METDTCKKRELYRKTLSAEIPAFLNWLINDFSIPEPQKDNRFGSSHFHHPALIESLHGTTPEAHHLKLMDQYILLPFKGTASELESGKKRR